jgi:hypothetical protein
MKAMIIGVAMVAAAQPGYAYVDTCPGGMQQLHDGMNSTAMALRQWTIAKSKEGYDTAFDPVYRESVLTAIELQESALSTLSRHRCLSEYQLLDIEGEAASLKRKIGGH